MPFTHMQIADANWPLHSIRTQTDADYIAQLMHALKQEKHANDILRQQIKDAMSESQKIKDLKIRLDEMTVIAQRNAREAELQAIMHTASRQRLYRLRKKMRALKAKT